MKGIAIILALLGILFALGSAITAGRIAIDLRSRGVKAHPALARWMVFKYMADYKRITIEETGTVGPLYQQCSILSSLAAVFALAAITILLLAQ